MSFLINVTILNKTISILFSCPHRLHPSHPLTNFTNRFFVEEIIPYSRNAAILKEFQFGILILSTINDSRGQSKTFQKPHKKQKN